MEVQVSVNDQEIVVTPVGELDAHNCGELGAALSEAVNATPGASAVIDAGGLSFIDSSAISELLRIREQVTASGGTLTLTNLQSSVRRVLEITGLLDTFGVN